MELRMLKNNFNAINKKKSKIWRDVQKILEGSQNFLLNFFHQITKKAQFYSFFHQDKMATMLRLSSKT